MTLQQIENEISRLPQHELAVLLAWLQDSYANSLVKESGLNGLYGCMSDSPITRHNQGEFEVRKQIQ